MGGAVIVKLRWRHTLAALVYRPDVSLVSIGRWMRVSDECNIPFPYYKRLSAWIVLKWRIFCRPDSATVREEVVGVFLQVVASMDDR